MVQTFSRIHPVLLSGGVGSRLWPLSRRAKPKQLLRLGDGATLFQETALRVCDGDRFMPPMVVCSAGHQPEIEAQLKEISTHAPTLVLEPSPRDTAAAAAIAALLIAEMQPDALMLILPTDHRIADVAVFLAAIEAGATAARQGDICLFGVRASAPAPGFGYIRVGQPLAGARRTFRSEAFVEKPDAETAQTYCASGRYLWNSGIFLMSASTLIAEFARHAPKLLEAAERALAAAERRPHVVMLPQGAFDDFPARSLDRVLMERTDRAVVVPVDFGWSDLGSWSMLWENGDRDETGNAVIGQVLTDGTRNSYIRSEGPLVATVGVEGLIVVATADAVLVAHRGSDQDIRRIVERLHAGKADCA